MPKKIIKKNTTSSILHDNTTANSWKPSEGINWDAIQRMRFANVDCEIDPEDSYSKGTRSLDSGSYYTRD